MPEEGRYLLANVGFSGEEQPFISLLHEDNFVNFNPLQQTFTLRLDTAERFCVGWYDMTTGESFACPDQQMIDKRYEQCPACQNRTGFNPAFYHATSVSRQQEERNLQPHFLYLAHFDKGIIKVGISFAQRGRSRLLEQGARTALILDIFPTAHIARQYEAQIAALPAIVEHVQLRRKVAALAHPYSAEAAESELLSARTEIEQRLAKHFASNSPMRLDEFYFPHDPPSLTEAYDSSNLDMISGTAQGMLGSMLFSEQQNAPAFLPLKKYIGYPVHFIHTMEPMKIPARQISLF